jgi:hypothetical protein
VSNTSQTIAATAFGAVAGALVAYIFFTDRGRALRRQLDPAIEDFARELSQFRGTVHRAAGVATEGWKLLNEAIGEGQQQPPPRYPTPHQSSPF